MNRWIMGRFVILAGLGAIFATPERMLAGLVVSEWNLATRTFDLENSIFQSALILTVENPLQTSHTASIANSSSTAAYDFAWTGNTGHFDIYPTQHIEQLDGETGASGRIYVRPSVDSFIALEGTWQYAWPSAAIGTTSFRLTVIDLEAKVIVVQDQASGGNNGLGPPFGTFDLFESSVLQADRDYMLSYSARIIHFDPTPPGTYGEASGALHFNITPVPEPATLALLVIAGIMSRRTA